MVKVATTASAGGDVWSIAASLGRATAAVLASPSSTTTILALQGIAVAALIAQRLLRSDEGVPMRAITSIVLVLATVLFSSHAAWAQTRPEEQRALREQLEREMRPGALTDGVGLRPKAAATCGWWK